MAIWTFVRHGESRANAEHWLAGWFDTPLTAHGEAQARALSRSVGETTGPRAFASDLRRAARTLELIVGDRQWEVEYSKQLRERDLGSWQCRALAEVTATGDSARLAGWTTRPPGGESLCDVAVRGLRFLAGIDIGAPTLIVAHGAFLRAVLGVVDGTPLEQIGQYHPGNCEVIERDMARGWAAAGLGRIERAGDALNVGD